MNTAILFDDYTGNAKSSAELVLVNDSLKAVIVSGTLAGTVTIETKGKGGWVPIAGGVFDSVGCKAMVGLHKSQLIRATTSTAEAGLYVEVTL